VPKTLSEKILSRKSGVDAKAGQIVTIKPDVALSHDNTAAIAKTFRKLGVNKLDDPDRHVVILDHCVPPADEKYALNHKEIREFVEEFGIKNFFDIDAGVCHQVLLEKGFVKPGMAVVGSDSHTTMAGAVGAFACGIGRSEMAVIMGTGEIWLRVPETMRIDIAGVFKHGVYAKDLALRIIGDIGADGALYKAVEFFPHVSETFPMSERMTLCNLAAEMGAKNAYFPFGGITLNWLIHRVYEDLEPANSDEDCEYSSTLFYDLEPLEPMVAKPHTVDNVAPLKDVAGTKVHQSLIGTCTGGRIEDLHEAADILKGRTVAKNCRLLIFPASKEVLREAMKLGLMDIFREAGGVLMNPGCGPCLGAHEGCLAAGEVCISSANRNFKGRMGCNEADVYLASPAACAASAVTGVITDPREFLGG